MYSDAGDTTSLVPGFPIRTSSDQRSVGSSPRLIAASNVLHRLPVPRHPPCALKHLQHEFHYKPIWKNCTSMRPTRTPERTTSCSLDARNPYPRIKHHTPPPKPGATTAHLDPEDPEQQGLLSQSPIVCSANSRCRHPRRTRLLCTKPAPLQRSDSSRPHPSPMERCSRGAP